MALPALIYVKGSVVKMKALGGAKTEVEIECINDDYEIDWGKKSQEQKKCHKQGVYYERGKNLEFAEQTISLHGLPSLKTDTVVKFLMDSLYETKTTDFDITVAGNSIEYTITITFTDPATNVITMTGFTTFIKTPVIVDGSLNLEFGFQPIKAPVRA